MAQVDGDAKVKLLGWALSRSLLLGVLLLTDVTSSLAHPEDATSGRAEALCETKEETKSFYSMFLLNNQ